MASKHLLVVEQPLSLCKNVIWLTKLPILLEIKEGMGTNCFQILSVEDNPGDRLLIEKFLVIDPSRYQLSFAHDGCEALDFLQKKGKFEKAQRPNLVLLDLNLPKKDGFEVLSEMKQDPSLNDIPVFVFTTSRSSEDRSALEDLGVDRFLSKPADIDAFQAVMQMVRDWLESRSKKTPA